MTRSRFLIVLGLAVCASMSSAAPVLAVFLISLVEGTKELTTKIHSETKGEGEEFKFGGGVWKCEENQFYGREEIKGHETSSLTILPWYHGEKKGCTDEEIIKSNEGEIRHNGCTFIVEEVAKSEKPEKEPYAGSVALSCPEGKEFELVTHVLSCIVFVSKKGNQSINGLEILNLSEAKPLDVHLTLKANNISYHDSGCIGVEKEGTNGEYLAPPLLVTAHNSAGTAVAIHADTFEPERKINPKPSQ